MPKANHAGLLAASTFAVSMLASAAALAQSNSSESEPREHWYGWQTLAVDGTIALTTLFVLATEDAELAEDLALPLLGAYAIGVPLVHAAHRRAVTAPSFAIRVLAPPIGFMLGLGLHGMGVLPPDHSDTAPFTYGSVIGGLLGVGGAVALDAAVFAYEPAETTEARLRLSPSVFYLPASSTHGPTLGGAVTGAF
jgi:hypothetical protein